MRFYTRRLLVFIGLLTLNLILCSQLDAVPLTISFQVEVANAERPEDQILIIPTQFSLVRTKTRAESKTTLTDPEKIYVQYSSAMDPRWLFSEKIKNSDDRDPNSKIDGLIANIENMSLESGEKSSLYLRGTAFDLFSRPENWMFPLLVDDLCTKAPGNEASCKIRFPAIQVYHSELESISYIRLKVFRRGTSNGSDLNMPIGLVFKKEVSLAENSRDLRKIENSDDFEGYLLYSNYHFDAGLNPSDNGIQISKSFEWRHSLAQAPGRLALLPGQYWIEREIAYGDCNKVFQRSLLDLKWGQYISNADARWETIEEPQIEVPDFLKQTNHDDI